MNKHPFLNALSATAYISFVASMLFYAPAMNLPEKSVIIPIVMLSLFVLSASMMCYFFLFQPTRLLIEGKQKEATKFFLSTVGIFALTTLALVLIWFSTTLYFSA